MVRWRERVEVPRSEGKNHFGECGSANHLLNDQPHPSSLGEFVAASTNPSQGGSVSWRPVARQPGLAPAVRAKAEPALGVV